MHYLFLCVWLLSFKIMFVKFILTCRCQSFILTAMYLLFVLMYHNPVYCQRAVGCFLVFGCINSPVNILHVYIFFGVLHAWWVYTLELFGKIVLSIFRKFTKSYEHSWCSTPSPTLSIFGHLNIKHYDKWCWYMILYCSLNLNFPDD